MNGTDSETALTPVDAAEGPALGTSEPEGASWNTQWIADDLEWSWPVLRAVGVLEVAAAR